MPLFKVWPLKMNLSPGKTAVQAVFCMSRSDKACRTFLKACTVCLLHATSCCAMQCRTTVYAARYQMCCLSIAPCSACPVRIRWDSFVRQCSGCRFFRLLLLLLHSVGTKKDLRLTQAVPALHIHVSVVSVHPVLAARALIEVHVCMLPGC